MDLGFPILDMTSETSSGTPVPVITDGIVDAEGYDKVSINDLKTTYTSSSDGGTSVQT